MSVKVKLMLTKPQASKLKSANKKGVSTSIRLSNEQLFNDAGVDVELSPEQFKKVLSASKSKAKRGVQLQFSPNQVGGLLPLLAGILGPMLISGISNAVQGKSFFGEGMQPMGSGMKTLGSGMQPLGSRSGPMSGRGRKKKV
jgi:hypothetical protein